MNMGAFGVAHGLVQDMLLWLVPIGVGFDWWDDETNTPRGYIVPVGQDIEQAKYPRLYARWTRGGVHKYGAGGVANSTKAPDKRGRVSVGKDDMGGTAASRVTAGQSGVTGTTLGAVGGDERLHGHGHTASSSTVFHGSDLAGSAGGVRAPGLAGNTTGAGATNVDQADNAVTTSTTVNPNGSGASQNVQPSIVCNYIIRAG